MWKGQPWHSPWLLGWPHHRLPLLGLRLLICTTELQTLPLLMSEGPPPLPKVPEGS